MSWLDRPCRCYKLSSRGKHYHWHPGAKRARRKPRSSRWYDFTTGQRRAREDRAWRRSS